MGFFARRKQRRQAAQLGQAGEAQTAELLRHPGLFGPRGRLLRNLYLIDEAGNSTEIDLLFLSRRGLVVIENKNYSGFVRGNPWEAQWTASHRAGTTIFGDVKRNTYPLYNPIWQNDSHIHALRRFLSEEAEWAQELPLLSLIVFSDRCTLADLDPQREDCRICTLSGLRKTLRRFLRHRPKCLSRRELRQLTEDLKPLTQQSRKRKRQHIRQVQQTKRRAARPGLCPLCGGRLVLRTATRGPRAGKRFYGCANYPHCRYTEPYDE